MFLSPLHEQELSYRTPKPIEKPLKDATMSKWLEALDDHLMKVRGVNTYPLAYVKREDATVPNHAMDPSTGYSNIDMEMTSRAQHDQYVYAANNRAL